MKGHVRWLVSVAAVVAVTVAMTVMHTSPASAEIYRLGFRCEGTNAVRCAWLNVDSTNNRIRAYGSLSDGTHGTDRVEITVCPSNGACSSAKAGNDTVTHSSSLLPCNNGQSYSVNVHWDWNNGQGRGTFTSHVVRPNVC